MDDATYYLDINGLSEHLGYKIEYNQDGEGVPTKYNENNYGLGISREKERQKKRIIDILTAGTQTNSYGDQSAYVGAGIAKRFGEKYYADLGVIGGAMTGYEKALSPLAALYAAFGKKDFAKLRLMYAPESEKSPSLLMMNLGIPFK